MALAAGIGAVMTAWKTPLLHDGLNSRTTGAGGIANAQRPIESAA